MLPGLPQRLKKELEREMVGRSVSVTTDSQRRNSAWIGGSMFASFSTFENFQISRNEYDEGKLDIKSLVSRRTY